jgi:hypothetical protein
VGMGAVEITPQAFVARFNNFVNAQAGIPLAIGRMEGDRLVYRREEAANHKPVPPLVALGSSDAGVSPPPASFAGRKAGDVGEAARDMYAEWSRAGAALRDAVGDTERRLREAGTILGMRGRANLRRQKSMILKTRGDGEVAALELLKSAAMMMTGGGSDSMREAGHDIFGAARCMGIVGRHTASAIFAEFAAYVDPASAYYGGKAADEWLLSLKEYEDPATVRFRISRGILNSRRYPVRRVAFGLHEASAALYVKEGAALDAAFDLVRAASAAVDGDGAAAVAWADVGRVMKNAGELFSGQGADMEFKVAFELAHMAGKLALPSSEEVPR